MSHKTLNFLRSRQCQIRNFQVISSRKLHNNETQGFKKKYSTKLSPKHVLSQTSREVFLSKIKSIKPIESKAKSEVKKAAVLVPLCELNKQMVLLYTVRAMHLKLNGGEVSFPGGMCDSSDKTLEGTALREAFEEIGINSREVDVWGTGPEINRVDVRVTPILGHIKNLKIDKLKINRDEVEMVFPVSLKHLVSPLNIRYTKFRFGKSVVAKTPVFLNAERRIWGLTAYITHIILCSLLPECYTNDQCQPAFQKILTAKK